MSYTIQFSKSDIALITEKKCKEKFDGTGVCSNMKVYVHSRSIVFISSLSQLQKGNRKETSSQSGTQVARLKAS